MSQSHHGSEDGPNDNPIALQGAVWMTVGDQSFGGAGRIALLTSIAECGSITRAAKAIGMSYKAAWDAIDNMNNLAGEPLVKRSTGGKGGGGTRLTSRGEKLVRNFRIIELEHTRFLAQLGRQAEGIADDFLLVRRLSMNTSARNEFSGKVSGITRGSVNDEVELELAGGEKIVAIVTHESAEKLGLCIGVEAFALINSSSIIVMTDDQGAKFSARNLLRGTISRLQPGAINTEVVIAMNHGASIAAVITNESATALGLVVGLHATGMFKASSVILATPA
ncbi:TOBE domain-containing protein [Actimicrobium antarcticum]|uniref:TOBE domain-containing protein n=1 Tax=Actimicrobium antarcticum TaxID=1051899 RepID=A0ABP7SI16_9BURK